MNATLKLLFFVLLILFARAATTLSLFRTLRKRTLHQFKLTPALRATSANFETGRITSIMTSLTPHIESSFRLLCLYNRLYRSEGQAFLPAVTVVNSNSITRTVIRWFRNDIIVLNRVGTVCRVMMNHMNSSDLTLRVISVNSLAWVTLR